MRLMSEAVVKRTLAILTELLEGKPDSEVFRSHNVDPRIFYRDLKDLKENVGFWSEIIGQIKAKGLFEGELKRKLKERQLCKKLERAARGYYYGPPHFGYKVVDGKPVPTEDLKTVSEAFRRFLQGEPISKIRHDLHLSRGQISKILRDRFYMGEFTFAGRTFKGDWVLPITPEEFDEVQRRLGKKGGRLLPGYKWKDGKRVLKEGWKKLYQEAFGLRLKRYSIREISEMLNLPYNTVRTMLKSRKVTGEYGYEQAVDLDTYKQSQKVSVPGYKRKKEEAKLVEDRIMASLPCYRWQLREKTQRTPTSIDKIVRRLKNSAPPRIKEREDGLLQRAWEPFPNFPFIATREKSESIKRWKILKVLSEEGPLRRHNISKKTGIHFNTVACNIDKLIKEGFIIEHEDSKLEISESGINALKREDRTFGFSGKL